MSFTTDSSSRTTFRGNGLKSMGNTAVVYQGYFRAKEQQSARQPARYTIYVRGYHGYICTGDKAYSQWSQTNYDDYEYETRSNGVPLVLNPGQYVPITIAWINCGPFASEWYVEVYTEFGVGVSGAGTTFDTTDYFLLPIDPTDRFTYHH